MYNRPLPARLSRSRKSLACTIVTSAGLPEKRHGYSNAIAWFVEFVFDQLHRHARIVTSSGILVAELLIRLLAIRARKQAGSGNRHLSPGSSLLRLNLREPQTL
jgi:hypothetical protein